LRYVQLAQMFDPGQRFWRSAKHFGAGEEHHWVTLLWRNIHMVRHLLIQAPHGRVYNRESEGIWDGIQWDGQRASFFPLRETEEGRARKNLLTCE
jgi:hypothetical protein